MENATEEIEGFVLAGGASSRMGRDKAQLDFGGITLVERAAQALRAVALKPINIVGKSSDDFSNGLTDKLRFLPDLVVEAEQHNRRGAIIGLQTVFNNSSTAWAAILACDLPFISAEFFERLTSFCTADVDAVVPIQSDSKWQPLAGLYRGQKCLPHIEKMLAENIWSVKELFDRVRTRQVAFAEISDLPDADLFFLNVNTPTDYEIAWQAQALSIKQNIFVNKTEIK